jgi:prepilin-type N-terminal cleavage/methylation domain-containing protein
MTMRTRKSGAEGMTLIEVLVATALLAIAILAALGLYDAARGSFKKGENATAQQEGVRIAYDRIGADLRMLGYNANPDGSTTRNDENLEVGLDHAIIFRGDFDGEDPVKKNDVESTFAGGAYSVVSTGNDEVVGYVLSNPDGTGPDTITFQADVDDAPRDGNKATVTVNNVVLNPTSPPYTLYKISLSNNVASCCSGDFIVRTPVAENIRNLTFQYYNPTSTAPIAAPGQTETAAAIATRASITRFNVSLIGMTKDPDMNYNDTTDPAAPTYRKFELRGDVVPRNMKMKGVKDLGADLTPPGKPATPTLLAGHCGGLLVTWAPNPTADGVATYKVNYGAASGTVDGSAGATSSPYFLSGLTTGNTYYITIQAIDDSGNISIKSNEVSATVVNSNTPSAPTTPSAAGSTNYITLNWTAVTTNTANVPAADPIAPTIRDLAGYRVYRGDTSSVTTVAANRVADETAVKPPNNPPFNDATTINCHTYFYKVTAVDTCGLESASTSAFSGSATTSTAPAAPTNVQAFLLGASKATVSWSAVTKDVNNSPITIGAYDVYRSGVMLKTDPSSSAVFGSTPLATVTGGATTYADNAVPVMTVLQTVYYMVKAKDECVNYSAPSNVAQAVCAFSGTVAITTPADGATVAGVVPVTVTVTGGTDTYTGVTITYTHSTAGLTRTYTSATVGTSWTDSGWLANPAGAYTITATVTNATGCSSSITISVNAGSVVGCCLDLYPTTLSQISCSSGNAKCKQVTYQMGNARCLTSVQVQTMTVGWVDYTNTKPNWSTAQFNGVNIANAGSWTTTYGSGTNPAGMATKNNFSAPLPTVPYINPTTAATATNVTYVFNQATDSGNGNNRIVDVFSTNSYVFTLLDSAGNPSGITTTCNLPSLTVN